MPLSLLFILIYKLNNQLFGTVPAFKIAPQIFLSAKITFDEGDSMRYIPCLAEGIPLPTVTWESVDVSIAINFMHK